MSYLLAISRYSGTPSAVTIEENVPQAYEAGNCSAFSDGREARVFLAYRFEYRRLGFACFYKQQVTPILQF